MSRKTEKGASHGLYHRWWRLGLRLAVVALVLGIGTAVWLNWDRIAPQALLDWTQQLAGESEAGEGFPLVATGTAVQNAAELGQNLVVLTDTELQFINAGAARVAARTHSFADPVLDTAGSFALVSEMGGDRFRLETRHQTVLEYTVDNRDIYGAAVQKDGRVALILNSTYQSHICELRVVDKTGATLFEHQDSQYLYTDVAFSANGKTLYAVGTTAENGVLKAVLVRFAVSSGDKQAEYTGRNVLLYQVACLPGGGVMAVGDTQVWTLAAGADALTVLPCDGLMPAGVAQNGRTVGVALRVDGATEGGVFWLFDSHGKRVQEASFEGDFRSLAQAGNGYLLLTGNSLYTLDATGVRGTAAVPGDGLCAVSFRGQPLLLTLNAWTRLEEN